MSGWFKGDRRHVLKLQNESYRVRAAVCCAALHCAVLRRVVLRCAVAGCAALPRCVVPPCSRAVLRPQAPIRPGVLLVGQLYRIAPTCTCHSLTSISIARFNQTSIHLMQYDAIIVTTFPETHTQASAGSTRRVCALQQAATCPALRRRRARRRRRPASATCPATTPCLPSTLAAARVPSA